MEGVQYELQEIKEVQGRGSIPLSGHVDSGKSNLHGPVYLDQGEWINVAIYHVPPNVDVLHGFVNSAGVGQGIIVDHNGVASYRYQAPNTDSYYAVVGAPTGGCDYGGHISW